MQHPTAVPLQFTPCTLRPPSMTRVLRDGRSRLPWLAYAVASALAGACHDFGGTAMAPRDGLTVIIQVSDATLQVYPETGGVQAIVPITIRSLLESGVRYSSCGNEMEREVAGRWVQVWTQLCTLPSGQADTGSAPPGWPLPEVFATELRATEWLGRGVAERWRAPLGGAYRVKLGLYDDRGMLPEAMRTSTPFRPALR